MREVMTFRQAVRVYLYQSGHIWNRLPESWRLLPPGRAYGRHLHVLARRYGDRRQNHSTFFLRNRAELELLRSLLAQKPRGSRLDIAVIACSKGAEVYSFMWAIRSARPDLKVRLHAVDIAQEIVDFAAKGVYSLDSVAGTKPSPDDMPTGDMTWKDQPVSSSVFERMTKEEIDAMFEVDGDQAKVRPSLKEGITWLQGDASDPRLITDLGPQDIVVGNRFLCHMDPPFAEECLRNFSRLVKPGGYLFVYGVDLDVRGRVAKDIGWRPITDMMKEVYDGDVSLRSAWPFEYFGLEPFCDDRPDWKLRCASVFQIGEALDAQPALAAHR
jgi:SAM-dependent methyltransferase